MTSAVAIIPARLASERFPEKVLADATGAPLVWHVYEAARRAESIARVIVAGDSPSIAEAVTTRGGEALLTGQHPNGTSRLAEAARLLRLAPDTIVVNVQADEPEIQPSTIDAVVRALVTSGCDMATAASAFAPNDDPSDPNVVKVVCRLNGRALYFSRSPIPHTRSLDATPAMCHAGIYAYARRFLDIYASLPASPLEKLESLEQLRALEHGHEIMVATVPTASRGIDTPEQYEAFVARRATDLYSGQCSDGHQPST